MALSQIHRLTLTWSTSRGRDTYGYNIARLDDSISGNRYRTCGGGYDMIGTVFAQWFKENYQQSLLELWKANEDNAKPYGNCEGWFCNPDFYGMTYKKDGDRILLDGACGLESIKRIVEACGFEVERSYNKKGHTTGFYVQKV